MIAETKTEKASAQQAEILDALPPATRRRVYQYCKTNRITPLAFVLVSISTCIDSCLDDPTCFKTVNDLCRELG